jgi:hypothetical protein
VAAATTGSRREGSSADGDEWSYDGAVMPASIRLLVGFACLSCAHCAASYVRGRVTDCRDSSPLEGVEVQLMSRGSIVSWGAEQTAKDGAYEFQVEHARDVLPVTLTMTRPGYQATQKIYASVPSSGEDVCMQPTVR